MTLDIDFHCLNGGDLRSSSPGFGTGLLGVFHPTVRKSLTGYDAFLLVWRLVREHLLVARSIKKSWAVAK